MVVYWVDFCVGLFYIVMYQQQVDQYGDVVVVMYMLGQFYVIDCDVVFGLGIDLGDFVQIVVGQVVGMFDL